MKTPIDSKTQARSNAAQSAADYQAKPDLLNGKIIVVTGAGSGIGRSAALRFAKYGASVVLVGRTQAKLEAVYDEIDAKNYAQAAIIPIDFQRADEQNYQAVFDALDDTFGHVDGLLNNAGTLGGALKPLEHQSLAQWQSLIQVNLNAGFMMTKTLLPLLKKSPSSRVIFTSARVGREPSAFWGAYAVAKSATEHMMRMFCEELGHRSTIHFNSLDPGAVNTEIHRCAFPAENPEALPRAEDIMSTYLFLMGEDSEGISGQQFNAQTST